VPRRSSTRALLPASGRLARAAKNNRSSSEAKLTLRSGTNNNLANVGRLLDCERNRTGDRIRRNECGGRPLHF
jgi:hypothetical protein